MSLMMKAFHAVTILKNSTTIHWVTFYKSQKINVCTVISQDPLHALVLGIFNSRHTQYWFLYYNTSKSNLTGVQDRIKVLHFSNFLVIYNHVGHPHAKNVGLERELSNKHFLACLYAGVKIGGRNRENGPSQVLPIVLCFNLLLIIIILRKIYCY